MRRSFLILSLLITIGPAAVAEGSSVGTSEFHFELPPGWRLKQNPKVVLQAAPEFDDGRAFAVVLESAFGCPIPSPIPNESSFERGYWAARTNSILKKARFRPTQARFEVIGGAPFHVVDGVREGGMRPVYGEVAMTPHNGRLCVLVAIRAGDTPENDADLKSLIESFTFVHSARRVWYQPLVHHFGEVIGTPLLLAAMAMGTYLVMVWRDPAVSIRRKRNVALIAAGFLVVNGLAVAGKGTMIGLGSLILALAFVFVALRWWKSGRFERKIKTVP